MTVPDAQRPIGRAPEDAAADDVERTARRRLLEAMPKAELHLHLDGSVRIDTAIELARTRGIDAPLDWVGMSGALVGEMPGTSQAELLKRFDLPIALMQDAEALELIAFELVAAKAADNVRYVEVRWGPLLHVARGLSLADGIAAVCRGANAAAQRAGVTVRLISTALRSHDPERNVELAETASRFIDQGLTAWDLAGQEAAFPDPLIHARSFEAARANGLRMTIHAGEWGGGPQVRRALVVDPERIAHGPGAIEDAALCAELRARGITLDLAPHSNWQAGIVPSVAEHPIGPLYRMGVPVTLSTDDLTVSDLTLSEEYIATHEQIGLSLPDLWTIDRHALDVAFADEATLAPLRAEFDSWAAGIPELTGAAS